MQVAVQFLAFDFCQRARPRFRRQLIDAVFITGRQPHRKQVARGVWSEFPFVGLNDPCENRGFRVGGDDFFSLLSSTIFINHSRPRVTI
jgi:hypothetical protein